MSIAACVHSRPLDTMRPRGSSVERVGFGTRFPGARSSAITWSWFALQILVVVALQVGDDVFRGNLQPPNAGDAERHARQITRLEQAHGLFVEPALQFWALHAQAPAPFGFPLYSTITAITNVVYALGQTAVPLLVAIWLFRRHRSHFPLVRNLVALTIGLAVIGYGIYPLAPPRLTKGLLYGGHAFSFQNTMQGVIGNGKLSSVPLGYNAYSAMPSLHIATALIVSSCILLLARNLSLRLSAAVYPFLMLFTVLVDANHYVLDAAGGVLIVALATVTALVLEPGHVHLHRMRRGRRAATPTVTYPMTSTIPQAHRTDTVPSLPKGTLMTSPLTAALDASSARLKLHDLRTHPVHRRDRMETIKRKAELDPDGIAVPSSERDRAPTFMNAQELREIDAALERLADGTYFQCAACGKEIPIRRLQVQPTTSLCVACQSRTELHAPQRGGHTHAA